VSARGLVLAAAVVLAAACGRSDPPAAPAATEPQRGGTLVVGAITDADAWNEYVSQQTTAINLLRRIYLRLAQEQGDTKDHPPSFTPLLAESWSFSDDGLTLTFKLRDCTWSDGTPVTANDVRFTWTAQTSPEVAWPGASSKDHIKGVRSEGDKTVAFLFDRAYPEMLADAIEGGILPEHVFGQVPFKEWRTHDWSKTVVGSGPFLLSSWKPGEEIALTRTPRYFDASHPYVDGVVVRVVPDIANLETQLLAGTVDLIDGVSPADAKRLEGSGITLVPYDNPMFDYIGWNGAKPPLDDPEVRRALTLAIDRQAIVDDLLFGYGRVSAGPLLSSWWPADASLSPWPYDPNEAVRILAAKGYGPKKPLALELMTNAGNRTREAVAVKIQEQLAKAGVAVTPRVLEMRALREASASGKYDAYIGGWRFSGKLDLKSIFGSASRPPGGMNVVAYASADTDRFIEALGAAPDWRAAKTAYAGIARKLHDDQPYTFLYEAKRLVAVGPKAKGVVVDVPADPWARLERIWIAR
jgi:peptide/nickel transport system substrate-binding protein